MKCISSSRLADDCVVMSCVILLHESDLVLAVLSVRISTDPDISWTVLCEQPVKDMLKNIFRVLSNAVSLLFSHVSLKISRTLLLMKFRSQIIAICTHLAVMCFI